MVRAKILVTVGLVMILALAAVGQTDVRPEAGPQQRVVIVQAQPQPPGGPGAAYQVIAPPRPSGPFSPAGPGPIPFVAMREYAEQLRARARQAQELADWLRRQADEVDQMAKQPMDRGRGPQQMGPVQRELGDLTEAIGRAEREGRQQEAAELRQRADQLQRSFQPMPAGPGMNGPQDMKRQIERLRAEAGRAKQEGRVEDSERVWKEADRMEQQLRQQGPVQKGPGVKQPGPRGDELAGIKEKIERLRDEAQKAKEQGRHDDAARMSQEADRLEQQLRGPGPGQKGAMGKPMPPEVQDILKAAEQAEREGRMDDARRQREKAEVVARQWQMQQGQGPKQPGPQLRDELMRVIEDLKKEIGRLWQAVNELRSRPKEGKPA
jgi:hypothetical protein